MITTTAPWDDPVMVEAAQDLACRVRDEGMGEIRADLALIPAERLHDLAMTLAAMIDVDRPLSTVRHWTRADFLRPAREESVTCRRGHSLIGWNAVANGHTPAGRQRWRCRECMTTQRKGKAA